MARSDAAAVGRSRDGPRAARRERELRVSYPVLAHARSLDRLIHERVRLGIASALAVNESLTFNELKALLKTTRRQPERARAHASKRRSTSSAPSRSPGGCPQSEYRLTPAGRKALERYLDHMEALIRATRER